MTSETSTAAQTLLQAAKHAFNEGDRALAVSLARQVLSGGAQEPVAHQIIGITALDAGDAATARMHLEASEAQKPNQPQVNLLLGEARRRLGDVEGARLAFTKAGQAGEIAGWYNLATLEAFNGDGQACIGAYLRVLDTAPEDARAHAALAELFESQHDLARAKEHGFAALRAEPNNAVACIAVAHALLREGDFQGAEQTLTPLVESAQMQDNNRANAWGIIGDARDRCGDVDAAFAAFTEANRLFAAQRRADNDAHSPVHPAKVREMARYVERADISRWKGAEDIDARAPVFLVGFPRSGTTLLDQILSSHPKIVCLEEKGFLWDALVGALGAQAGPELIEAIGSADVAGLRRDYWRRILAHRHSKDDAILIDKLPLHIVLLPVIRRVFPAAKIIVALRDPRDVILSCYQQRFKMNAAMAQFLDLESAAEFYDAVMDLFVTCRERLDLRMCEVRYENLVTDIEGEAKRLTAFLGVPFERAMLDYRSTARERLIGTPSARQVVEPLYARSIGRWRPYAEHLAPVLPILDKWASRLGYET